jgi:hypothetical protein
MSTPPPRCTRRHTACTHAQAPRAATVEAPTAAAVDWPAAAKELDPKSPLEIMDHVSRGVGV